MHRMKNDDNGPRNIYIGRVPRRTIWIGMIKQISWKRETDAKKSRIVITTFCTTLPLVYMRIMKPTTASILKASLKWCQCDFLCVAALS